MIFLILQLTCKFKYLSKCRLHLFCTIFHIIRNTITNPSPTRIQTSLINQDDVIAVWTGLNLMTFVLTQPNSMQIRLRLAIATQPIITSQTFKKFFD